MSLNTLIPIRETKSLTFSNDHVTPLALMAAERDARKRIVRGVTDRPRDEFDQRVLDERLPEKDEEGRKYDDAREDLPEAVTIGKVKEVGHERIPTGIDSLDRQLSPRRYWTKKGEGGGPVIGHLYGISGPPGSGKTTILLQALMNVCANGAVGALIDGEESFDDTDEILDVIAPGMGIRRKELENKLFVIDSTRMIEPAFRRCEELDVDFVVINSLQEFTAEEMEDVAGGPFMPGNPAQKKAVIRSCLDFAKGKGEWSRKRTVFLVVQVKGDGEMDGEGNKVLHKLDVAMEIERDPDFKVEGSEGELRVFVKFVKDKARGGLDPTVVTAWRRVKHDGSMEELGIVEQSKPKRVAKKLAARRADKTPK